MIELVVANSVQGTSSLIPVGKEATHDPMLKIGDRVEMVVCLDNQASSVKQVISKSSL